MFFIRPHIKIKFILPYYLDDIFARAWDVAASSPTRDIVPLNTEKGEI